MKVVLPDSQLILETTVRAPMTLRSPSPKFDPKEIATLKTVPAGLDTLYGPSAVPTIVKIRDAWEQISDGKSDSEKVVLRDHSLMRLTCTFALAVMQSETSFSSKGWRRYGYFGIDQPVSTNWLHGRNLSLTTKSMLKPIGLVNKRRAMGFGIGAVKQSNGPQGSFAVAMICQYLTRTIERLYVAAGGESPYDLTAKDTAISLMAAYNVWRGPSLLLEKDSLVWRVMTSRNFAARLPSDALPISTLITLVNDYEPKQ